MIWITEPSFNITSTVHEFISNCQICVLFSINVLSKTYYRGHTVRAVCESFRMSKDAGFKVVAHMMPDLPNVGWERDIEQFIVSSVLFTD